MCIYINKYDFSTNADDIAVTFGIVKIYVRDSDWMKFCLSLRQPSYTISTSIV